LSKPWNDRILALAGIFQSAALVKQLATTGHVANCDYHTAVHSLFEQSPQMITDVYPSVSCLETGLEHLHNIIKRTKNSDNNDIIRYVIGIIHLQKKLLKRNDMLDVISTRIQQSQQQAEHFTMTHENVIASLADIYTETISTFTFRIQVTGDYNYLQQKRIADQVRVLLFSGIRAAVLWRQLGGNRLQVIIKRKQIIETSHQLILQAKQQYSL